MQRVHDGLGRCGKSVEDDGAFSRTQPSIFYKLCDIQLSVCFPLKLRPVQKAYLCIQLIDRGGKRDASISFMINLQGEKGREKS